MLKLGDDGRLSTRMQTSVEHLSDYQRRDFEVVDYKMYELEGTGLFFRGPSPHDFPSGKYFTCIGAAQTFGCFCERPYPALLSESLGLAALNLGYGGAGPEFFANHEELDRYVNGGQFAIIQVMSGRSQSNSLFDTRGLEYMVRRSDGAAMGADVAYQDLIFGPRVFRRRPFRWATHLVAPLITGDRVRRVVNETRLAWIESYRRLLSRITVPAILLWFSKRAPAYVESYRSLGSLFGEFPQLVNAEMVNEVRGLCGGYAETISSRGSPQPLKSRFTGRPVAVDPSLDRPEFGRGGRWTHNAYYPSPEMQEDAAEALLPICESIRS
jgi:hypothetical protein